MITNYFKLGWRHLNKNKLYSFINFAGFVIGITGCLFIGIYIWHEWSYDRFHDKSERIVRVTWDYRFADATEEVAVTGTKVGPEFKRQFPEVEEYVRLNKSSQVLGYEERLFEESYFLFADDSFFDVFSFPLLQGNAEEALAKPESIVLTRSAALKYFGNEDPMGKILTIGGAKELKVTAIAENPPSNSQIKFDMVVPFGLHPASKMEKWNQANYITYLQLNDAKALSALQEKVTSFAKEVGEKEFETTGEDYVNYKLQPITEVHLQSHLDGLEPNSSATYLWVLGVVALLILIIACVNYTNLSIAQAAGRNAEIGIRKVLGAGRGDIFRQFMAEAVLMSLMAVFAALILAYFLMPFFNSLSGKDLVASIVFQVPTVFAVFLLALLVAFFAGAYPAVVLSRGQVTKLLKTGFSFSGSNTLRKGLITFQFVISIFLIIATVVILQQLNYIQDKDLGYEKEQILILPLDSKIRNDYEALKTALGELPGVASVASAYEAPTHFSWSDGLYSSETDKNITVTALPAEENIVETLGLTIISGEPYTQNDIALADTKIHGDNITYTYILNEAAVKAMGWTPQEAIGKRVEKGRGGIIRAVVRDFHFRSLHEPIAPLVIFNDKRFVQSMFVRLEDSNISKTLASVENIWKERVPHRPFEYQFLDEKYTALYKAEQSIAAVFTTFSIIAIFLACLGLFALTAFAMVKRNKEIGIRKILGASVCDILTLVSGDFIKLVFIAVIIALPLSVYSVNKWLESFSYRVSVEWWVLVFACVGTLLIATITVCLQAAKTAFSNPIKNLRTE